MRVAAVVLTYNSSEDLPECLAGLVAQRGVDLRIIVVDNASRQAESEAMQAVFQSALPEGRVGAVGAADTADATALFLRNQNNAGYSAGNNIGARVAAEIGCDAVLIINPDVRLSDPNYIQTLAALSTVDGKTAVACSALRNLSDAQENPMNEPGFVEEMLWPVQMIVERLKRRATPATSLPKAPLPVEKVSGACFLIRLDFLQQIEFFDESVFLYCEESILRAQVRSAGLHMMMDPTIEALHAHRSSAKGDPLPRFVAWSKSRAYFHKAHSGYGPLRQMALAGSRALTLMMIRARGFVKQRRGRID